MKKIYILIALFMMSASLLFAQTEGTLSVSVSTSEAGGGYAPSNVVAIWVQDDNGNFVKTLLAYAASRKTHLNNWQAVTTASGSAYDVTDATTGATRSSHSTRTCTWNATDVNGAIVPDGTYHLYMELTDRNNTGNISSYDFLKGPNGITLSPADEPSFSSVNAQWSATSSSSINSVENKETFTVYPNPGTGIYSVKGDGLESIEIKSITGKSVGFSEEQTIDISSQPNGIYFILIKTEDLTYVRKISKI